MIASVSCGLWHSLALSTEGVVFSSGESKKGALGRPASSAKGFEPVPNLKAAKVKAGNNVSFFLAENGKLFSCGKASLTLHAQDKNEPSLVKQMDAVTDVACGRFTCAAVSQGKVFAWGDNTFGQLGQLPAQLKSSTKPVEVHIGSQEKVVQVSLSSGEKNCHGACATESGQLWTWGD